MDNSGFEEPGQSPLGTGPAALIPVGSRGNSFRSCYKTRIFGKWIFIKALHPDLESDSRYIEAFRKEQEIGLQFDHPNLAKYVIAPDLLPGRTFVAMEYIDGVPLGEFIAANGEWFSLADNVGKFIREISSALAYLHSRQILHLDLKPDNIMVTRVGHNVKIIDFGFSHSDTYTESAGFTSGFIPPERLLSKEKTEAADYYGLGKLLEYIRLHTPGYPVKQFSKLESGLLVSDPHRRIHATGEIGKALRKKGRVPLLPLALTLVAAAVIAAGFIFMRRDDPRVTREDGLNGKWETAAQVEAAEKGDTATEATEAAPAAPVEAAEKGDKATEAAPAASAPSVSMVSAPERPLPGAGVTRDKEELDALRRSVVEAVRRHMTPLSKEIREALDNNDFSDATYERLSRKLIETPFFIDCEPFIARYPSLDEEDVFDMVAFRTLELNEELWAGPWREYKKKFIAYRDSVK